MIQGNGIRLRAIEKKDLPLFVEWLNDHEVRDNLDIYSPFSTTEEDEWYIMVMKRPVEEHPLAIEIKLLNDWHLVGDVCFINYDQHNRSAEFGIFIGDKDFWGKGYGTKAASLMLQYGFQNLNLNRIYLRVFESNLRAIKCYEKAGFILEGKARQAYFMNGKYIDVLMMSVLKNEWKDTEI